MPLGTPEIKINALKHHGKECVTIILHGKSFDQAAAHANQIQNQKIMILPFDDPHVIAGQGTIAVEILQQIRNLNTSPLCRIFVCCGDGGMLAGIATYIKQIRPQLQVIGVEAEDAAGMTTSLQAGKRVILNHVGLFADGAAVKLVGGETYHSCHSFVDEMVTVSTDEICAAIKGAFIDTRVLLEPAGALAMAGVKRYVTERAITGETLCVITSGANIDLSRLGFVSERASSEERLVSIEIEEQMEAFRLLHAHLLRENVSVTEFSYRYSDRRRACIYMSFQAKTASHARTVLDSLSLAYCIMDLSENELAKSHGWYLSGKKALLHTNDSKELLYRFKFPDYPNALGSFLNYIKEYNITLFYYRNHGADIDRVLVGFHVSLTNIPHFHHFLRNSRYTCHNETENEMYQSYLLKESDV